MKPPLFPPMARTFAACALALALLAAPRARAQAPPVPPETEAAARAFLEKFFASDFAALAPMMDATMNRVMTPQKSAQVLAQTTAGQGAFKSLGKAARSKEGPYEIVVVETLFEKGSFGSKVVFDAAGKVAGFQIVPVGAAKEPQPPPYADPKSFREEQAEVVSGEFHLPAVLTLPVSGEKFPVAVLVHGSGPNDKDETIGPIKVFRDIAWGLASRGIASIRYEKRTRAYAKSLDLAKLTVKEEVTDDACAAAKLVAADPRFDSKRVVLVGHSLGGCLAPRIAKDCPEVRAIVIMAGSTRPLMEMMEEQINYIAMEDGKIDAAEQSQLRALKAAVEQLNKGIRGPGILGGVTKAYLDDLNAYDAPGTAAKLSIPIYAAQGGRDYQVLAAKDFEDWRKALDGKKGAALRLYPKLNHLFIEGEGKSYPREYSIPANVSGEFVGDIARWIGSGFAAP